MSTAFLFTGQGAQFVGMGATWYQAVPAARLVYEQADALLGYALSRLCFEGPAETLDQTEFTQPALFTTELALWAAVQERWPEPPAFIAGHSLGEFAALVAAGALTFADGLHVVTERGRLMAQAGRETPGAMAALLGATPEAAQALCAETQAATGETLVVANDNCPGQLVLSGTAAAIDEATRRAAAHGIRRVTRLALSIGGHSPLMAPAEAGLAAVLAAVALRTPQIPVVFNATAAPLHDPAEIRAVLTRQLTSPVRWRESLLWLGAHGVNRFVEVGPKEVLAAFVKRTLSDVQAEVVQLPAG